MTREQGLPAVPTLAARQEERAERILVAAEELLLRCGYNLPMTGWARSRRRTAKRGRC